MFLYSPRIRRLSSTPCFAGFGGRLLDGKQSKFVADAILACERPPIHVFVPRLVKVGEVTKTMRDTGTMDKKEKL